MTITAEFLQRNIDILAPVINNSINTILRTGCIAELWKTCFIIPIPKKGSSVDISNYRGIALQSVIPKILDKVITRFLDLGSHISNNQHGFVKESGTITNLLASLRSRNFYIRTLRSRSTSSTLTFQKLSIKSSTIA